MPIGLLNNTFIQDLRKSLLVRNLNPTTEANLGGLSSLNLDRGQPTETSLSQGEYVPLNQESVVTLGHYPLKTMGLKNRYAPESYPVHEIADNLTLGGNIGTYDNYVRTQTSRTFDLKQFILGGGTIRTDIDTPLGVIGAEQLKSALEANIAQNTIKNTLGRVNLNLFSLLNGEEFLIRDYSITTFPNRGLGFFANLGQKYTGFEIPVSYIPSDAFGFLDSLFDGKVIYGDCKLEDLVAYKDYSRMDGIDRNNNLLLYTGRGNRVQLFNLLGINKYRPNYDNNPNEDGALNRIFGYLQQRKNNDKASYDTLEKTRRSSGMLDVMGRQGIANPTSGAEKGKTGAYIRDDARSVIQQNGLPKITWTNKDKPGNLKRFMFSIENLAWIGNTDGLPECELGNGDPNSDDKRPGRIMWFPPYDLTFDESVSVQWDKNNFIGRGEPIFTYNNTTRSGTIKFRLVVDHPSILNEIRQSGLFDDSDYVKFFKGVCNDFIGGGNYIDGALSLLDQASYVVSRDDTDAAATKIVKTGQDNQEKNANATTKAGSTKQFNTKIFFANNSSTVDSSYQNGGGFNLNGSGEGFASTSTSSSISNISSDSVEKVEVTISTSHIKNENDDISQSRYEAAASWIRSQINGVQFDIKSGFDTLEDTTSNDPNAITEINNRWALIEVVPFLKDLKNSGGTEDTKPYSDNNVQDKVQSIVYKIFSPVYSECDYFKFLEKTKPLIFQSMSAKLKYFNPGFHSTTPEGLNSRLTFLHQCTRQGPSIDPQAKTSNLAFGRPPICILRIGDFFHTKMVIESMSISYDEGVLWDLNPEGIGLQPRLATVSLTVSYLGGQSLMAPIRELQNALGFNFYANTETFQHAPKQIASAKVVVDNKKDETNNLRQNIISVEITRTAVPN